MAIDWDAVVLSPVMAIFGEGSGDVTYYPLATIGSAGFGLADAVFDEAHTVTLMDGDQPVSTVMPCLGVRQALFADYAGEPTQGAQVRITGKGLYVVRDPQPDGHGHVLLLLNLMVPE
jgi:hypothetical protein